MKKLREGITTGSCATAAAVASAIWQKTGCCPAAVEIDTPIGRVLRIFVEMADQKGTCYVKKDGGDDPDITDGCHIEAKVEFLEGRDGFVLFKGGKGIGVVTEKGLKLSVGEPAINPVPRQMIQKELAKVIGDQNVQVTISIPNGEALAKQTLNKKLGIIGGLSILGTTGIVRPMSEEALKDSLALELSMRRKQGHKEILLVLGMAGERMAQQYLKEPIQTVQMGNYIGFMLEEASKLQYQSVIVAGAAGKIIKLAAGIMNTHSHMADGRKEVLCTHAALHGAKQEVIQKLYHSVTIEGAISILEQEHLMGIWQDIAKKGEEHCRIRSGYQMKVRVILFDRSGNVLGDSMLRMEE